MTEPAYGGDYLDALVGHAVIARRRRVQYDALRSLVRKVRVLAIFDGRDPVWCPSTETLWVGTDLTPEQTENVACQLLGALAHDLA